jgi:hypothetical protein
MSDSRDKIPNANNSSPVSEEKKPMMRKVGKINTGFREIEEPSELPPRIFGIKPPVDAQDRYNLMLLGIALIIAVLIFGLLELKQLCEVIFEASH